MREVTTPSELATELGKDPATIRSWLVRQGLEKVHTRWSIPVHVADAIRAHYTEQDDRPELCSVEGCERHRKVRAGLCKVHWQRWKRHGTLDRRDGAEHQRAKTHCPQGHEYTPENTYVFKDGRRRCRTCRISASLASTRRSKARDAPTE